jgi:hypothetical protein
MAFDAAQRGCIRDAVRYAMHGNAALTLDAVTIATLGRAAILKLGMPAAKSAAPTQIGPIGNPGAFRFAGARALETRSAARQALAELSATPAQLSGANRAIGRATSSSTIDVGTYGQRIVVRVSRPGHDGRQVVETVLDRDGAKTVVQMAYDSNGRLVHYDPKLPLGHE